MKFFTKSRIAASLGVLVILATGCAPAVTSPGGSTAPSQSATSGNQKLTIGQASITPTMMPYISICCTQRRYDVFDTVVGQKDDGSVEPAGSTSWKVVNPTTWEFTIRSDMKFHDGTAVTPADVAFSINRAIDPAKAYAIASRLRTVDKAEVGPGQTVLVRTKSQDPLMLKRMALISILPQAYLTKVDDAEFSAKPIGSGPFKVVSWVPDDRVTVARVEDHPFRQSKFIAEVTIRSIGDPSARVAGLKTGELDVISTVSIDQVDSLKQGGFTIVPVDAGGSGSYWIDTVTGDQPRTGPLANKLVRQAMNYAVDKELIVKNVYKGLTKVEAGQILQPQTFGYNPNLKPYPFDPAKAKQLLAQAGYGNGFKVNIAGQFSSSRELESTTLIVQQQLKDIGIEMVLENIGEYAIYRDYFYGDRVRPDIFAVGQVINRPAMDADFALVWFWGGQPGGTRHYNNPEFDKAYLASTTEMDEKKRLEHFARATEVMYEDPPSLFLVQGLFMIAHKANLKGFGPRTDLEPRYDGLRFE